MISLFLIEKYIKLFGLEGLQKRGNNWTARCPICNDSQTNKKKKRFWILIKPDQVTAWCFNCGYSTSFINFLKDNRPILHQEYTKEEFLSGMRRDHKTEVIEEKPIEVSYGNKNVLKKLSPIKGNLDAYMYFRNRKFPKKYLDEWYYSDHFMQFLHDNKLKEFSKMMPTDKRIVIPFFNEEGILTFMQGRAIGDDKVKYLTCTVKENEVKIWGMDNVDKTKNVFVFEGVFDACFVNNSLALAGSSFDVRKLLELVPKNKLIYVPDNDYRVNKEVRNQVVKYIDNGIRVALMPKELERP
jgi:DNA primase